LDENEQKRDILDGLGLLHLQPISDIAQQANQSIDSRFSTQQYSKIPSLQQLFHNPELFYHTTRLSITEFILLHDSLVSTITSVRSHSHLPSDDADHSHPQLAAAEQLLLWICHVTGSPTTMLELVSIICTTPLSSDMLITSLDV